MNAQCGSLLCRTEMACKMVRLLLQFLLAREILDGVNESSENVPRRVVHASMGLLYKR